jgi:hypothetical protein
MLQQFNEIGGITLEELIANICQLNKQLTDYFKYGKTRRPIVVRTIKIII